MRCSRPDVTLNTVPLDAAELQPNLEDQAKSLCVFAEDSGLAAFRAKLAVSARQPRGEVPPELTQKPFKKP